MKCRWNAETTPTPIQDRSDTDQIPIGYRSDTDKTPIKYVCRYNTHNIPKQLRSNTDHIPIKYIHWQNGTNNDKITDKISIQYRYNTDSIPIQYRFRTYPCLFPVLPTISSSWRVEDHTAWILKYARVGLCKIGVDNDTVTGPVARLYLWKEWNTRTAVDASSTQAFTFLPRSLF